MMIFEKHTNLKYKFGNRYSWTDGHYVSTVGLNTTTIQKCIREQEKKVKLWTNLKLKEYVRPFYKCSK